MMLTRHERGSLKELWAMAAPLMIASLSVMIMFFCDRWFLAYYSIEAHNATVGASTLGWACVLGGIVLCNVVEVFVAQYHGVGMKKKIGEPVWQMVWFSIATFLIFIPLSFWGTDIIYGHGLENALERDYFRYMVLFGPFYALNAALSGFYIGLGKMRIIVIVVCIANILNVLLDWIFIFGIEGFIPSMGIIGAAIATSFAVVMQGIILGSIFLIRKNRVEFGTGAFKLRWQVLFDCLRVGSPTSLFMVTEVLAFALFYALMKEMGPLYITVTGICQSILILFLFFPEGINKATATIVGNLIGAKSDHLVNKVVRSGWFLNLIFLCSLLILFYIGTPFIANQFLPQSDPLFVMQVQHSLGPCLMLIALYLFFESVRNQYAGVLMAAGDTLFLFITGALSVWVMIILPVYFFVVRMGASVEVAVAIEAAYPFVLCVIYYIRVKTGSWRTRVLSNEMKRALEKE